MAFSVGPSFGSAFGFGLKEFKGTFFDAPAVVKQMNAYERQKLTILGAFIRKRARTSIRKRKGISQPGSPPHSHEGSLRRLILFAYDPGRRSVVVGPVKFKQGKAPRLLEHGGDTVDRKGRQAHYRPRPAIRPAGEAEVRRFPQTLRGIA